MDGTIRGIVDPVLERLDAVLGSDYSAVVYGSAARGEHLPGVSDLNLLVICPTLGPDTLRRLAGALAGLRSAGQPPPLLIERGEWERATDVFPIEVTEMRSAREVVRGADPVAGRTVDPADLRRALEAELRAKLLRLRQAYAVGAGDPALLGQVAMGTITSIAALFRAALALYGRPVSRATPQCLDAAGAAMGVSTAPVVELWKRHRNRERSCPPALFEGYLSAVGMAVRVIDQFTGGGH
jgi:predicted nucleotidyltransferase